MAIILIKVKKKVNSFFILCIQILKIFTWNNKIPDWGKMIKLKKIKCKCKFNF